jgi:mannosyltransferase OCH1-like enzyme
MNTELNPALRSDFLRLELLYLFGGIYADVDMTCEKSLQPLLIAHYDLITGLSNTLAFEINNGLIISKP